MLIRSMSRQRLLRFTITQTAMLFLVYMVSYVSTFTKSENILNSFFTYLPIQCLAFMNQVCFIAAGFPTIMFYGTLSSDYYSSSKAIILTRSKPSRYFLQCLFELLTGTFSSAICLLAASLILLSKDHFLNRTFTINQFIELLICMLIYVISSFTCILFINCVSLVLQTKLKMLGCLFAFILLLLPLAIDNLTSKVHLYVVFPMTGRLANYLLMNLLQLRVLDYNNVLIASPLDIALFLCFTLIQIVALTFFLYKRTRSTDVL